MASAETVNNNIDVKLPPRTLPPPKNRFHWLPNRPIRKQNSEITLSGGTELDDGVHSDKQSITIKTQLSV